MKSDKVLWDAKSISRRTFVAGAAVAGAAAVAATQVGCGDTTGGGSGGAGGVLSYYLSNPAGIDPYELQESEGTAVGINLFDGLVEFDYANGELVPAVAESWERSDDAKVFTFHLKEGTKFHNGDTVTAGDFKFAFERICNPDTAADASTISYHLGMVDGYQEMIDGSATELTGVKALDDTTLEITLSEPFADFLYVASHATLVPVPSQSEEIKDFATFSKAPIGNGPFKMEGSWMADQYIQVRRFDDYYGEVAKLDGVDFKIYSGPDVGYNDFLAGNLDFAMIATGQIQTTLDRFGESSDGFTVTPGKQTLLGNELSVYYFDLNNAAAPFDNLEVRKAVSLAINRQAICDTLFEGTRLPADGIVPPDIPGYEQGSWQYSKYDVEAAKQALVDAGYPEGAGLPAFKLSCNTGGGHEEVMQMVQSDLAAIGINAELEVQEWGAYLDALSAGQFQFARLGWINDYPIFDNSMFPLFGTGNGDNHSQYSNPEVDTKIKAARAIIDDEERITAYQEINKIIGDDCVLVPVMFYRHHHVGSERIKTFYYQPDNKCKLNTAELV